MRTGASGETTKLKTLSVASASFPARTLTRMLRSGTVKGANTTDADPFGAIASGSVWMPRPPISSVSVSAATGAVVRLATDAVTVTRSCSANVERAIDTDVTAASGLSVGPPISTGVMMLPGGRRDPSSPRQPLRWKSLIRTTSRCGSGDSARMLPATFSAGP